MAKLVVFYSRAGENYFGGQYRHVETGNTEKVARMIAEAAGAKLFKIEQKVPYPDGYEDCKEKASRDRLENARPELAHCIASLDGYDEIYVGHPIFYGTMPMAVCTFLEKFDWTGKTVRQFVTHEGSVFGTSSRDLRELCRGAKFGKAFEVTGSRADGARAAVVKWIG